MRIENEKQLRELYDLPSGRVNQKVMTSLDKHARNFINKSPFMVISSVSENQELDASPRGGVPGFVKILNDNQIILPDSKGNNRIDTLRNIVDTGRVGVIFLIPGVDETLRLNGSAYISTDPVLMDQLAPEKKPLKACIVLTVEEVFLHCAKALMRSKLWDKEAKLQRSEFPTMGQMIKDQIGSDETPESHKDMVERYKKDV